MAQPTTTAETFSGAAAGKAPTFTEYEKFVIQQEARRMATSGERAGKPFNIGLGVK